jgi:ankyrin repeat protein
MAARLARKKKEAEEFASQDKTPTWVGKDHKVKLSYIIDKGNTELTKYPCLCKRFVTEPSFRVYAGEERRAGKLVKFKRNVFVAPYELIEMCIGDGKQLWYGRLTYDKHNVIRRKATKDDTWNAKVWLDAVQKAVQDADKLPNMDFILQEQPNKTGNAMDFTIEIKERINGRTVNLINKGLLTRITGEFLQTIKPKDRLREFGRMTVLPSSPKEFVDLVLAINFDRFIRLVKRGHIERVKTLVDVGYLNVHKFEGEGDLKRHHITEDDDEFEPHPPGQGWNALQFASYFGRRPMVMYLLDELKMHLNARSVDGWNAMHCACKMGHFEIAKEFYNRGMSLFFSTQDGGGGYTPLSLMMENKHMGMIRFFIGEDSKYALDLYKSHGVRPTHRPEDMYYYLKPLPEDIMVEIRKSQNIKYEKLKAQKLAQDKLDNPEKYKQKEAPKLRGSSKNGRGRSQSKDTKGDKSSSSSASKGKSASPSKGAGTRGRK